MKRKQTSLIRCHRWNTRPASLRFIIKSFTLQHRCFHYCIVKQRNSLSNSSNKVDLMVYDDEFIHNSCESLIANGDFKYLSGLYHHVSTNERFSRQEAFSAIKCSDVNRNIQVSITQYNNVYIETCFIIYRRAKYH